MPYIATQVSTPLTPEKEKVLKERFGQAIELLGKTESWLMLSFADNCRLWFQGNQEQPSAFICIKLFGKASPAAYEKNDCRGHTDSFRGAFP